MRDPTKTLILGIVAASATFSLAAYAVCQDVYDPMSNRWVYVCTASQPPVCHNEYDPMNNVWVLVCH
jgi:hypothetical protein